MKRIEALMTERQWTRRELGRRSRIDPSRVGKILTGRIVPYPVELARLSRALSHDDPETLLQEVTSGPTA